MLAVFVPDTAPRIEASATLAALKPDTTHETEVSPYELGSSTLCGDVGRLERGWGLDRLLSLW